MPESVPASTPVPNVVFDEWWTFLTSSQRTVVMAFLRHGLTKPPGLPARDRAQFAAYMGVSVDMLRRLLKQMIQVGIIRSRLFEDDLYYWLDLSWVPLAE